MTINGIEWKNFGNPKIHQVFEGNIVNNYPHGEGELSYPDGNIIKGFWKNGKLNGKGTFIWLDGKRYIGYFRNGIPSGQGTYTYKDGTKKSGKWLESKQKFIWEKNKSFVRKFDKKKYGILSYRKENAIWGWFDYGDEEKDGKYIGGIKNLKPNGYGTFTFGIGKWRGDRYEGMWLDGAFDGEGILIRKKNGEKFVGEWKKNDFWNITKYSKFGKILKKYENGKEVQINNIIEINKKNIKKSKKEKGVLFMYTPRYHWDGIGKEWSKTGDEKKHGKYQGEILNGLPNGNGTYSWFNVNKYIGEFRNGMFHGKGTFYTLPSKVKIVGEFKNDKEWNAIQTDKEGKVIGKFINGELRKQ